MAEQDDSSYSNTLKRERGAEEELDRAASLNEAKRDEEAYIEEMRKHIDDAFGHVEKAFPGAENLAKRNEHYLRLISTALEIVAEDASLVKGKEEEARTAEITVKIVKIWSEIQGKVDNSKKKIKKKKKKKSV
jgi:predicted ribosome quality control (RQC) complex YloA/Tae2 family protein